MLEEFTQAELQQLIENGIEEDTHLDYKAADALLKTEGKKNEIAKDVSAFANADGGKIIYGIKEFDDNDRRHLPEKIDPVNRRQISKEWLEQVINSKIRPKILGVVIRPIPVDFSDDAVVYVVDIPRSTVPHQASDRRYYKRYNFESASMEDYEISDVRNRQSVRSSLINIDVEICSSMMVYVLVRNIGNATALDVTFNFPEDVNWIFPDERVPSLFTNGMKVFPPGKSFRYMWNMAYALFAANDPAALRIDASTTYLHGFTGEKITEEFNIDLEGYRSNSTLKSDVEELGETIKENAKKVVDEIAKLNRHMEHMSTIGGSTGLDFSHSTLINLKELLNSDANLKNLPIKHTSYQVLREILEIDVQLAHRLEHHFRYNAPPSLDEIEGITNQIRLNLEKYFYFEESADN